jgi:Uma2 family endonuclease
MPTEAPPMSTTTAEALMTAEEWLALPDDGVDRWLIRGHLREKSVTKRNRWHSRIMSRISYLLETWLDQQPEPRGEALSGEAGCRLAHDPDTAVGIDVAYIGPELAAQSAKDTSLIDGVPTLVVEILSPNDTQKEIHEKIVTYLQVGVPLVWIVDSYDQTIKVFRPNSEPELFNMNQEISGEPHMPGFTVKVAKVFGR